MPAPKKARKIPVDKSADATSADVATATATKPAKAAGKRVLLVDDDTEIVESMRTVLESRGYESLVARDGNQGLMMAKRSGFLVLEKLRRSRPVPMKVIMITANEGSRHKAYAEMLGVDDYIRKPFAMDRLLASIDKLLS
jgi:DNA-binding response OmpR family regulator